MNLQIRTILNNNIEYKSLCVDNITVPNSSLLDKNISNSEAYKIWMVEDIDTVVKANIIKKTVKIEDLPDSIPTELWLALCLESKEPAWQLKLHNIKLSNNIYPAHWNITSVAQLKHLIKEVSDPTYFYSHIAALNKNSIIQSNGKPNSLAISKGVLTEVKTKSIDTLSWTTSFIKTQKKIEGIRETYQLQKIESGWKTRKFVSTEDVDTHIERELLPLRHKAHTDDATVVEIIENLKTLNIPIEILMVKELNAARAKNSLSLKLIEHGLNVRWEQIELQVYLMKEKNIDNADIIQQLRLSTSQIVVKEDADEIEMPIF